MPRFPRSQHCTIHWLLLLLLFGYQLPLSFLFFVYCILLTFYTNLICYRWRDRLNWRPSMDFWLPCSPQRMSRGIQLFMLLQFSKLLWFHQFYSLIFNHDVMLLMTHRFHWRSAAEKQYEEIPQEQKPSLLFEIYRLPGVAEEVFWKLVFIRYNGIIFSTVLSPSCFSVVFFPIIGKKSSPTGEMITSLSSAMNSSLYVFSFIYQLICWLFNFLFSVWTMLGFGSQDHIVIKLCYFAGCTDWDQRQRQKEADWSYGRSC